MSTWALVAAGAALAVILLWGRSRSGFSGDAIHVARAARPETQEKTHATGMTRILLILAGLCFLLATVLVPAVIVDLLV